jgi:hypothetical protein
MTSQRQLHVSRDAALGRGHAPSRREQRELHNARIREREEKGGEGGVVGTIDPQNDVVRVREPNLTVQSQSFDLLCSSHTFHLRFLLANHSSICSQSDE